MACVHEFGILPTVPKPGEEFDYTPQKYNCVTIEDDLLEGYGQAINAAGLLLEYHRSAGKGVGLVRDQPSSARNGGATLQDLRTRPKLRRGV